MPPAQEPLSWPLEPSLVSEDLESLPSPRDVAAAVLFAVSTGRETVRVSQRHTEAQTVPLTWAVMQAATEKVLPSTGLTYGTHIKHKHRQTRPLEPVETKVKVHTYDIV